ncbi:MAG: T9SS type A sorting domain-containing protein [Ignavibacteria bacterium]|nr:T9SS type A sorting domain-containing protein [Ignavibacteria bacterium]
MKISFPVLILSFLFSISVLYGQNYLDYSSEKEKAGYYLDNKGIIYFKFVSTSKSFINDLSQKISIDNIKDFRIGYEVFAFANKDEFAEFLKYNIPFEILPLPNESANFQASDNISEILAWDVYPTYDAYVSMMYQFQTNYPNLCKIVDAGNTVQGRKILFAVISDSVNFKKPKPQFEYVSTIHGDETTGYVLMLRLIDTLLSGYGVTPNITKIVKNVEIWINPLANPDGTYKGGNNTVNGAWRYNANSYDLNRNFPDPAAGPTPGGTRQIETTNSINLAKANNFTMSMNFHGGAEVFNYPWDTWSRLHPDDDWFIFQGIRYVDTVHANAPSTYMDDLLGYPNIPGIVNGFSWYRITGGRQDYMTYFHGSREVTLEISNTKLPNPSLLPTYWNYNAKSFLHYITQCLYGVRGIITDSLTGQPVRAKVRVTGKEIADSTWINSDSLTGNYNRPIKNGTYTFTYSAENYVTKTVTDVYVKNDSTTILNVLLRPIATPVISNKQVINSFELLQNYPNPFNSMTIVKWQMLNTGNAVIKVFDITGKEIATPVDGEFQAGTYEVRFDAKDLSSGIYFYKLTSGRFSDIKKMILIK